MTSGGENATMQDGGAPNGSTTTGSEDTNGNDVTIFILKIEKSFFKKPIFKRKIVISSNSSSLVRIGVNFSQHFMRNFFV